MTKRCEVCESIIETDDWYSFIRVKYCRSCAQEMRRLQNAERMRELRRKTREANALTRQLCKEQQREIDLLRAELIRQRERVARLEGKHETD